MDDRQRARAVARTFKILAEMGITPAEASLLATVKSGLTLSPAELPLVAAEESYSYVVPATEEGCRAALAACLAKSWLQIIDEASLAEITDDLRKGGVIGPVYGLPSPGEVDFTRTGADLWRLFSDRRLRDPRPVGEPAVYSDVVYEKSACYYRTRAAAAEALEKARGEDDVVSVSGPYPTGPWRAQWWRRFPEGYRIDVEKRPRHCFCTGENLFLERPDEKADPRRLRYVLDRHNVTFAEWVLLACMENGPRRLDRNCLPVWFAVPFEPKFGQRISEEEYRRGLDACLRHGWLRVMDRQVIDDVHALLRNEPAYLAISRKAELRPDGSRFTIDPFQPGKLVPIPVPIESRWGEIDISPAGAALYRVISVEWLGPDWEDDLRVWKVYEWEEHHYCESDEGFQQLLQQHVVRGEVVRAYRVVPIGPWCTSWWEQFPGGFRLELELSDP